MTDPTQAIEVAVFQAGDKILSQGEENPFFFVILSGHVVLSRQGKQIRMLSEQDVFGLENILLGAASLYSAEAVQECRVARYGPETLDHLIYDSPRMTRNVLVSLLHQLRQTSSNLLGYTQDAAPENGRLCFYTEGEMILEETLGVTDLYRLIASESGLLVTMKGQEVSRIEKPGEFFGFPVSCAHASVQSIGESIVEQYPIEDLDIMVRNYPEPASQIMRMMIERLRKFTEPGFSPQT